MKIIRLIYLTLILCTLISTFFVMNCSAKEDKFGISLYRYNSVNENIDYSEDIILVLTIVNNYDYWISIGGGYNEPNFKITINNGDNYFYNNDLFANEIFIEPKSEFKIFIPFDYYNKKNLDERLGNWQLQPEIILKGFELYEKQYQSKPVSTSIETPSISDPIKGNLLEFTTTKPDVEVINNDEFDIIDKIKYFLIKENKTNSDAIIVGIIVIIVGFIVSIIRKNN